MRVWEDLERQATARSRRLISTSASKLDANQPACVNPSFARLLACLAVRTPIQPSFLPRYLHTDRQTDGRTDERTGGRAGGQTDGQTDRQTGRQTD